MSLWNKVSAELVDIIEYVSSDPDVLVYRFPRYQNQIKYGAKLIVREGQGAIFVNEGKLADVFTPGTYTLETKNLPVLSTLAGWKYGFNSPFKAEVYFYTTRTILDQQWGTQQPVTMELPKYGLGEIRAYGQASYKILDASLFFRQVVGTNGFLTGTELRDYLRGVIVAQSARL
jgi:membrane protease subunit (stomatin/prohibitin family)